MADKHDVMNGYKISQYSCAVLLILTSIALVTYQVVTIDDVANGLLFYVAQAFMLAGSIFGLDYYIKLLNKKIQDGTIKQNKGPKKQQPSEHTSRV